MNTFFRTALLAAVLVVPTAAFAQSVEQIDETQVEVVAYEVIAPDAALSHVEAVSGHAGTSAGALSDSGFNPGTSLGLNSIYTRH